MNKQYDKALSLEALAALPDEAIDYTDVPDLGADYWTNAVVKMPQNKARLTVRFDADMVQWFKSQGRGYQTRMNAVLRSFYESHQDHR